MQETIQKAAPHKIWYLEWLRIFACLAVVLIHCFVALLSNVSMPDAGVWRAFYWTETLIFLARWAVPVFFMISGALLLNPKKEITYKKALEYVGRMLFVLVTFGYAFAFVETAYGNHSITIETFYWAALSVLCKSSWGHLWFIYDMLGIYLLLPLFKSFINGASKRDVSLLVVILGVFGTLVPTINGGLYMNIAIPTWFGSSVFYFVLGYYLHTYIEFSPVWAIVAIAAVLIEARIVGYYILVIGEYASWAHQPSSAFVALYAAGIFLCAKKYLNREIKNKLLLTIASASFCIYIIHPVFTNLLYRAFDWINVGLPPVVFELTTYVLVFVPSLICAVLIKKLPVFKKFL